MRHTWQRMTILGALIVVLGAPSLFAQKYEINPHAGFVWPSHTSVGQIENQWLYGLRAGVFLDSSFELEGNVGYMNHFNLEGASVRSRAWLWEAAGNYNFSAKDWPVVRGFTPFLVVGVGAIRTDLRDGDSFTFSNPASARVTVLDNHNTFFSLSYGGGMKSVKLWGPLGLRADVRGRTIPNFYHSAPTWLEVNGGFNLMWGEK
jgi:hypothetical protein